MPQSLISFETFRNLYYQCVIYVIKGVVVFSKYDIDAILDRQVILQGKRDYSTGLWLVPITSTKPASNPKAQTRLGAMYAGGQGDQKDYITALMWMYLAAAQGDEQALEGSVILANLMTPAQIEEAQRLAREWLAAHP